MKTIRLLVACFAISALFFAVGCGDDDGAATEDCTDGVDNDGDLLTDCQDGDCIGHPSCASACNLNGTCEPALGENSSNCANDCPICNNNGTCDAGENNGNCPADCPAAACNNDGNCDAGETTANCPADCPASTTCTQVADLVQQNGCPGQSCTVLDANGTIGCAASGSNADYSSCAAMGECLAGSICAGSGGNSECLPFCEAGNPSSPCPGAGQCLVSMDVAGVAVGLCTMPDSCDPFGQTGCTGGEACYFLSDGTLCGGAGTGAVGSTCGFINDCSPGMICIGPQGSSTCAELCDAAFTCTSGTCQGIGSQFPAFPLVGICQP